MPVVVRTPDGLERHKYKGPEIEREPERSISSSWKIFGFIVHNVAVSKINPLINRTSVWGRLYSHQLFEPLCLLMIVANALWLGYETERLAVLSTRKGAHPVETFFCVVFSIEILIRLLAYTRRYNYFRDPLKRFDNSFDLFLVLLLLVETYGVDAIWPKDPPSLPALSSLRLFRLLRIIRILRLVPELAIMVKSLLAALRSVSMTFVLVVIIIYVFALILTTWAREHVQLHPCDGIQCMNVAFASIPQSFLTLMQVLCFDNTFSLLRAILNENVFYGFVVIAFMVFAGITLLNILIGIICEIVSQTNEYEQMKLMTAQVDSLFEHLDTDHSGKLSRDEIDTQGARDILQYAGLNYETLSGSFEYVDLDPDGFMQLSEFKDVLFKLMKAPDAVDILSVQKKLEKLQAEVVRRGGFRPGHGIVVKPEEKEAIFTKLSEFESQLLEVPDQDKQAHRTVFEAKISRLEASLRSLHVRLDECVEEASTANGNGYEDHPGSRKQDRHRHRLCHQVVEKISETVNIVEQLAQSGVTKPSDLSLDSIELEEVK